VMTHEDQSLYLFLALAADRNGVSFYRKEKICDCLGLDFQQFEGGKRCQEPFFTRGRPRKTPEKGS